MVLFIIFGRAWIFVVTVRILNYFVDTVNYELSFLVVTHVSTHLHGICFSFCVNAYALRVITFNIQPPFGLCTT